MVDFKVGDKVRITGVTKSELNGQMGVVKEFVENRIQVELSDKKIFRFQPANPSLLPLTWWRSRHQCGPDLVFEFGLTLEYRMTRQSRPGYFFVLLFFEIACEFVFVSNT